MKKRFFPKRYVLAFAGAAFVLSSTLVFPVPNSAGVPQPPSPPRFYFGNFHAHTSYSDGSGTPKEAYKYARETGDLDFLAITEHNHAKAGPTKGDRKDDLLIATDSSLYPKLISDANAANEDNKFVAIYGQEFSTISKGNHTNVFMANKVIRTPNGEYETVFSDVWMTGFGVEVIQLNHPWDGKDSTKKKMSAKAVGTSVDTNYGFNRFPSRAAFVKALDGRATMIEVVNGPGLTNPEEDEEDEVLFGTVKPAFYYAYLNLGLHLAPTGDQDNHYRTWGTLTETRTVVIAPKLTRTEILKAMKERRVYATEDKDLQVLFKVNGKLMGSINPPLASGGKATITVSIKDTDEPSSAYQVKIFYDPGPGGAQAIQVGVLNVNNNASGTLIHTPTAGKGYYFLVVTSTKDANEGYSAWTAPVWFE